MTYCKDDRIIAANQVLQCLAHDTWLRLESGYVVVHWRHDGSELSRRWMTRGQDFFPTWYRHWGHGGTCSTALSQLVRFVQGKPVLPLSTWRYWGSLAVGLLRNCDVESTIRLLLDSGYPEHAECVLCHCQIDGPLDWWNLNGVSGPCCSFSSGCRQMAVTA